MVTGGYAIVEIPDYIDLSNIDVSGEDLDEKTIDAIEKAQANRKTILWKFNFNTVLHVGFFPTVVTVDGDTVLFIGSGGEADAANDDPTGTIYVDSVKISDGKIYSNSIAISGTIS